MKCKSMTVSQYVMGLWYQSLHTNILAQDCNEQHKCIGLITQGGGREENDIHQAQGIRFPSHPPFPHSSYQVILRFKGFLLIVLVPWYSTGKEISAFLSIPYLIFGITRNN